MKRTTFGTLCGVWRRLLLVTLCAALLGGQAFAGEPQEAETPYDGYLVHLAVNPYARGQVLPQGTETVYADIGLYHVSTRAEVLELEKLGLLLSAEPNYQVTLFAGVEDTYRAQQWDLTAVEAESAWDQALDGTGVRVGIIDSGVMTAHEDLTGANIMTGWNYLDDNSDVTDEVGHGTFVTGVIAARRDNGIGVAGLADGAEIVPLKCFDSMNGGLDQIIPAIYDSVDKYGCQILNLSFGVRFLSESEESAALKTAIDYVVNSGTIVVAAVGNSGSTYLYYPAAYDNVIGVGSVDADLAVCSFSQQNTSVTVVAPGEGLWGLNKSGGYVQGTGRGTSYSCPMVVAAAALMKEARPELTPADFVAALEETSVDLGTEGYDRSYGYGLLSLSRLTAALVPQRVVIKDGVLTLRGVLLPGDRMLLGGAYSGEGKLLQAAEVTAEQTESGQWQLSADWVLPEETAWVKLFDLYRGSFAPAGAVLTP